MQGHLTSIKLAMAELAELSLVEFRLVKAIHSARSVSKDASIFEQAAEHVPDLEHQIARAGLVIDSRALSSDEASAYINDVLVELKGENADIEAFTTRRSPYWKKGFLAQCVLGFA